MGRDDWAVLAVADAYDWSEILAVVDSSSPDIGNVVYPTGASCAACGSDPYPNVDTCIAPIRVAVVRPGAGSD